ncbi:MAG: hypothetical protein KIT84_15715 [Labilithrix sp.]|nr:hypothetical protein [Labilithrix sp.]MCW5812474.1 hypothetical protein [Labilithrix sp.]
MTFYATLLILKFLAVMAYAGAATAAYLAPDAAARKWLAHRVAGPAITVVWTAGYTLMTLKEIRFTELWIVAGAVGSLAANLILIRNVGRPSLPRWAWVGTAAPLVVVVACMVLKPTWEGVLR